MIKCGNELLLYDAGWNQTERDWRGYLSYDPEGCFVAEVRGQPAGTATTIRYGDRFGWIGMVLVHPDHRRLGLGTRLLKQAIARLQECGVRCTKLDATPMGRTVYVPLGFALTARSVVASDTLQTLGQPHGCQVERDEQPDPPGRSAGHGV